MFDTALTLANNDSALLARVARVLSALSNERRLAVMNVVAHCDSDDTPLPLSELSERLGLDPRTISKEVVRLIESGLLQRQKDGVAANLRDLSNLAERMQGLTVLGRAIPADSPLQRYLSYGRIVDLPKRADELNQIAVVLANLLPSDCLLSEVQVNRALAEAGDDVARLRRLLVDLGLVSRSGAADYRRTLAGPTDTASS